MEAIEYKEVNGSVLHDAHIYAKIKLDDGTIATIKAYPIGRKWDYDVFPHERKWETVWAFRTLFM